MNETRKIAHYAIFGENDKFKASGKNCSTLKLSEFFRLTTRLKNYQRYPSFLHHILSYKMNLKHVYFFCFLSNIAASKNFLSKATNCLIENDL